jgi:hypothetical protein
VFVHKFAAANEARFLVTLQAILGVDVVAASGAMAGVGGYLIRLFK